MSLLRDPAVLDLNCESRWRRIECKEAVVVILLHPSSHISLINSLISLILIIFLFLQDTPYMLDHSGSALPPQQTIPQLS